MAVARCYIRASSRKQKDSPIVQRELGEKTCAGLEVDSVEWYEEKLGTSGRTSKFRDRPEGKRLLLEAQHGDYVVVYKLDRLGRTIGDIHSTIDSLTRKGVRIIPQDFFGGSAIDTETIQGKVFLAFFAMMAEIENDLRRDRIISSIESRKERGIYVPSFTGFWKKVIRRDGQRVCVWNTEQLDIVVEIAKRLGRGEKVAAICRDFRRREIKDFDGRPWGETAMTHKPYHYFRTRVQQLHRYCLQGKLPFPYNDIVNAIPKTARFKPEPRKYNYKPKPTGRENWTPEQYEKLLEELGIEV